MASTVSMAAPAAAPARLPGIDSLRGALACSVMLYHYLTWASIGVGTVLDRTFAAIGLYAVEAFFVISGMSLGFAYRHSDLRGRDALTTFGIRRFFRIAPLFYLVLAATLVLKGAAIYLLRDRTLSMPGAGELLGNFTLLFGMWDPSASLVIAGWSIGIEMTFYLLFPALAWLFRREDFRPAAFFCAASAIVAAVFATGLIHDGLSAAEQWPIYVNVANHLPFFLAGMLLAKGEAATASLTRRTAEGLLIMSAASFILLSAATPTETAFVCGWRRAAFGLLTIGLVWTVSRRPESESRLTDLGRKLGDDSYAIYLTHFLHFTVWRQVLPRSQPLLVVVVALVSTVVTSRYVFRWIETPMIAIGKQVARRLTARRTSQITPGIRRAA